MPWKVILTPGHTEGGICLFLDPRVATNPGRAGARLGRHAVLRLDRPRGFQGGDMNAMRSLSSDSPAARRHRRPSRPQRPTTIGDERHRVFAVRIRRRRKGAPPLSHGAPTSYGFVALARRRPIRSHPIGGHATPSKPTQTPGASQPRANPGMPARSAKGGQAGDVRSEHQHRSAQHERGEEAAQAAPHGHQAVPGPACFGSTWVPA